MKIAFLLTVHFPDDERVWYQQAETLRNCGHEIFVISSKTNNCDFQNTVCFDDAETPKKQLIQKLKNILIDIKPEIIICDNPISVVSAKKYKKSAQEKTKIIYDVTEWYPSKLNLQNMNILKKIIKFFSLIFLSLSAGFFTDKFIFGEYHKGVVFRILFPLKKYIYLSYFANSELIKQYPINDISKRCEFFYSGNLKKVNGFDQILKVVFKCAENNPNTKFVLKLISRQNFDLSNQKQLQNVEIKQLKQLNFLDFCNEIGKSDIFFDLRQIDFVNNHSLPIKIFYYLASGRPVIYSDLKAIKRFFPKEELNNFGAFVNPKNIEKIVAKIENYIKNFDYYNNHCNFAYNIIQNKYNWDKIKSDFINFIENNG